MISLRLTLAFLFPLLSHSFAIPTNPSPRLPSSFSSSSSSLLYSSSPNPHPQPSLSHVHAADPEVYAIILKEQTRQRECLELIASENFPSPASLQPLSSALTNKYSEGQPYKRYYSGTVHIDEMEVLCQKRALELYDLDPLEWSVNVQPLSGTPANMAVYTALLKPGEGRIMGLSLASGGHLSHGHMIAVKGEEVKTKPISGASVYFKTSPYEVDPITGVIDYDDVQKKATHFNPHMLICGASSYPRNWEYARMREIANSLNTANHRCLVLTDMSHISGLVASKQSESPFFYSDVVTTTTHKTLRGPRGGLIFMRKEFKDSIDRGVFPGMQGGPHNNQIGGMAVALKLAKSEEFKAYGKAVLTNARVLGKMLVSMGFKLSSGGTDNHLLLIDIRPSGLSGSKVQEVLEFIGLTTNKNSLPSDTSAINPGGTRLGLAALTSRGMGVVEMEKVAEWFRTGVGIGIRIQKEALERRSGEGGETKLTLREFAEACAKDEEVMSVREDVRRFARAYYLPGEELER